MVHNISSNNPYIIYMKFIHTADIHLGGSITELRKSVDTKPISIKEATLEAFEKLIDLAISEKVDFLVIAGDLFDSNWKDYSIGLYFIQQIERLTCPIYYIKGNHDADNRLIKKLSFPKHFHTFSSEFPETIINEGLRVALHGQSYSSYHIEGDLTLNYPTKLPGYINIGLLHTCGEKRSSKDKYAPYSRDGLTAKGYDYWALGHKHAFEKVQDNPFVVYSGSIQARHIKERGLKGCVLVSIDQESSIQVSFQQLSHLLFSEVSLDLTQIKTMNAATNFLHSAIDKVIGKKGKSIIRVYLEGTCHISPKPNQDINFWLHELHLLIKAAYQDRVFIEKVVDQTQVSITGNDKTDSLEAYQVLKNTIESNINKESYQEEFNFELKAFLEALPQEIQSKIESQSTSLNSLESDILKVLGNKLGQL